MKSKRADGKGHYPAGKRRNAGRPPKGWDSIEEFLAAVDTYCREKRKYSELARQLGVQVTAVRQWLDGTWWPAKTRRSEIARWYRAQVRVRTRGTP